MAKTLEKLRTSITGKILLIGLLVLVLLIPMSMVESVIADRSHVYRTAAESIIGSWGKEIVLIDPVLTVDKHDQMSWSNGVYTYADHYMHLSPDELSIIGHIETRVRARGIFKVPVYTGTMNFTGRFSLPPEENSAIEGNRGAKIQMLLNTRSIKKPPELTWNGEKITMTADKDSGSTENAVFYARLNNITTNDNNPYPFELTLELSGSTALTFHTRARQSDIRLTSNWDSPGFFGATLPMSHDVKGDGFSAAWNTSNFFTDLGHENSETIAMDWFPNQANFGVKLIQTVDTYQLVTRATKYAVLFLTLIFAVYLLYEIPGNVVLHPLQYLFIGFSNCVFYLLLLSLAEHIHFNLAYVISAVSSTLLVALYSMSMLKSRARGALILVELSVLYTFLFITLKSEDYALLIGSIGLFTILSLIMYFTRNFNWYMRVSDRA
jgi:inner membrane protein